MDTLADIFVNPFAQMAANPVFLVKVIWEGLVAGMLYALIALGFVLIYKASGVFNFAQGIMVVFAALTLVGLHERGLPAYVALVGTLAVMLLLAIAVERVILRPLVNQPDITLLMATIGLTSLLIGLGEIVFGGEPKTMITRELGLPSGSIRLMIGERAYSSCKGSISWPAGPHFSSSPRLPCSSKERGLAEPCGRWPTITRRRYRSASPQPDLDHRVVHCRSGGAGHRHHVVSPVRRFFALEIIALRALPVLILGGLTSIPGAIVGGLIIGVGEKLGEIYWGRLVGGASIPGSPISSPCSSCCSDRKACSARRSSNGYRHALPRSRPVQDELRCGPAIFPLIEDRIGMLATLLVAGAVIPPSAATSCSMA